MEFQEFFKQYNRICRTYSKSSLCDKNCPFYKEIIYRFGVNADSCKMFCMGYPEEAEKIVEQWVKEHPFMTNIDKFKEVFGVNIEDFEYSQGWWEQEYKEPEGREDEES